MVDINFKYAPLIEELNKHVPFVPDIVIILGSGLGEFAGKVDVLKSLPTASLPGYPASTVAGHEGKIHFAKYENKKLLIFQGRIHYYEGYKLSECIIPVHISNKLGCKKLLITNAAGGINYDFEPGDLMLVQNFNSINILNELSGLIGLANVEQRNRLLDFPSKELNGKILEASSKESIDLQKGSYWYVKGPSYETPSEIRMYSRFGADAVGMSTVHEAYFAHVNKIKVCSISLITNKAAGYTSEKLSHSEVIEVANLAKEKLERLVKRFITLL
ncbi:MAG: purine-nucleoside phosphorylase [Ignavibacteria bacterium]|jgi:purine-nucleoside phosphorylase